MTSAAGAGVSPEAGRTAPAAGEPVSAAGGAADHGPLKGRLQRCPGRPA
jgi:hypothetical protein